MELVFLCMAKYTIEPPSVIFIAFKLKSLKANKEVGGGTYDFSFDAVTALSFYLNAYFSLFYLFTIFSLLLLCIGIFKIGDTLF